MLSLIDVQYQKSFVSLTFYNKFEKIILQFFNYINSFCFRQHFAKNFRRNSFSISTFRFIFFNIINCKKFSSKIQILLDLRITSTRQNLSSFFSIRFIICHFTLRVFRQRRVFFVWKSFSFFNILTNFFRQKFFINIRKQIVFCIFLLQLRQIFVIHFIFDFLFFRFFLCLFSFLTFLINFCVFVKLHVLIFWQIFDVLLVYFSIFCESFETNRSS